MSGFPKASRGGSRTRWEKGSRGRKGRKERRKGGEWFRKHSHAARVFATSRATKKRHNGLTMVSNSFQRFPRTTARLLLRVCLAMSATCRFFSWPRFVAAGACLRLHRSDPTTLTYIKCVKCQVLVLALACPLLHHRSSDQFLFPSRDCDP